jgi:hypothetical protein
MVEYLNGKSVGILAIWVKKFKIAPGSLVIAWRQQSSIEIENFRGGEVYSIMLHAGGEKTAGRSYSER